jgi:hypothetical protein
MRRAVLAGAFAVGTLFVPSGALSQGGPQPLPMEACANAGTPTAHAAIPADAPSHERVPHLHTFGGVEGCFHFNPTASPPG